MNSGKGHGSTRYPEVSVDGTPREMGRQIGESLREPIRGFCEIAVSHCNKTVAISPARAMSIAEASIPLAEAYSPDMVAEMRGTAEAAGVSLAALMLLQVRNQFLPEPESGCTSFSISANATADGHAIVAQNWDNDPWLDEFIVVLTRRPVGRPAWMALTPAGLISYFGLNRAGIAMCGNALPAPSRETGVPYYFVLRAIHQATTFDEVSTAVAQAKHAIPANVMLATPQGPADLEITLDAIRVLRDEGAGYITHTNHCVHPDLTAINDSFSELIDSRPRKHRIDKLLAENSHPFTIDDVQRFLSDHDRYPRSICRHENDDPHHGFWKTVFSLVVQPTAGRMHVSRGNPCCRPYETYTLDS
ncbi:MAG: C45 family peptidase [Pirellulaceae bacterium]|nr:C45 family peptidase [Pirellulaceae bacterium]